MILYRYEGCHPHHKDSLLCFEVVRETEYEYIIIFNRKYRYIDKAGKDRFAYPTKEEARISYMARKRRQIRCGVTSVLNAEEGLRNLGEKVVSRIAY